jgi:Ni,Fe-hydrogenase I cytochrome b subunit
MEGQREAQLKRRLRQSTRGESYKDGNHASITSLHRLLLLAWFSYLFFLTHIYSAMSDMCKS